MRARRTLMSSLPRPGTSAVMVKRWSSSSTCTGGRRAAAVARLGRPASACLCIHSQLRHTCCLLYVWELHATLRVSISKLIGLGCPANVQLYAVYPRELVNAQRHSKKKDQWPQPRSPDPPAPACLTESRCN